MGVFDKFSGINVASGFKLHAKAPLDPRAVVDTIADRDALITENGAYEGMQVYVKEDKKTYCLKSLRSKKSLKVGDTLPEKLYYDTSIVPEIGEEPHVFLVDDENNASYSFISLANVTDTLNIQVIGFDSENGIAMLYVNSDINTIEEINDSLTSLGASAITKKGWQGDGVFNTGSAAGKPIAVVNDPQGIFYVGGPEWEEVGAGRGLNGIVTETIVLTAENVGEVSAETIPLNLTAEQTEQMKRANIIFMDASVLGTQYSNLVNVPLTKFDFGFLGAEEETFIFSSATVAMVYNISVLTQKQADGTSQGMAIIVIDDSSDSPTIPTVPYNDYYMVLRCRYGSMEWNKPCLSETLTLSAANWQSDKTQTLLDSNVYNEDIVIVSPAGDPTDYANAGIYCSAQGYQSLTFTCETIPTINIQVNILIF